MANLTTLEHASPALGAVAIVQGASPRYPKLKSLFAERIPAAWADHPGFDLDQHIRRVALPRPGDDIALFQAIAHALERPLALNRPLWECWIIEGLQRNRWAILMRVHHSMADGTSAAHLLARLCDDADADSFTTNHLPNQELSPAPAAPHGWTDALWQAPTSVFKAAARVVRLPATWLAPTGTDTIRRHYRTVRIPLADVDRVCRKFGVSANDVALAAISEGFRAVLLHRGEQPRADSLRTLEQTDRRIPALLPFLPVEQDDLVKRLRAVHTRLNRSVHQAGRSGPSFTSFSPINLCAKAIQACTRLPQSGVVTLATNAPGPRRRLRLMGQSMDQVLPIPPTALHHSTGVAVLSYGDELVFGMTDDYDAASDMAQLAAGIERGMARLVALSADSVLLFGKNRRRRSPRIPTGNPQRRTVTPPARARH